MTDDLSALDNLRPEVREAVKHLDRDYSDLYEFRAWPIVRVELLRLANENVGLRDNRLLLEREVENLHRELEAMESKRD